MADSKITALASIGTGTDPANDPLVIVDVSDILPGGMSLTGTTKKVTLNNLLACSPTATLASATITGDLTVDTSTLKVDSANNRVGILTASPAQALDVASGNLQVRTGGIIYSDSFSNYGAALQINAAGSLPLRLQIGGSNAYEITSANVHTWQNVGGVAGTAMTLNSTGLGVGVVPSAARFEVGGQDGTQFYIRSTGTAPSRIRGFTNSVEAGLIGFLNGGGIYFDVNGERMRIDSAGNPIFQPSATPATLGTNGMLTVNATSNTNLRFSYRGSDGVTRVANLTLA